MLLFLYLKVLKLKGIFVYIIFYSYICNCKSVDVWICFYLLIYV